MEAEVHSFEPRIQSIVGGVNYGVGRTRVYQEGWRKKGIIIILIIIGSYRHKNCQKFHFPFFLNSGLKRAYSYKYGMI
jgi:hypothetical protein